MQTDALFLLEKQLGQLVADDLGYSYRAYIENNLYYLPQCENSRGHAQRLSFSSCIFLR